MPLSKIKGPKYDISNLGIILLHLLFWSTTTCYTKFLNSLNYRWPTCFSLVWGSWNFILARGGCWSLLYTKLEKKMHFHYVINTAISSTKANFQSRPLISRLFCSTCLWREMQIVTLYFDRDKFPLPSVALCISCLKWARWIRRNVTNRQTNT